MTLKKLEKNTIRDIMALTPLQEGMLFQYTKNPQNNCYVEQLWLTISGRIDKGCFEKAWLQVTQNNELLRTLFRWENVEEPVQIILKEHIPHLEFLDLMETTPGEIERRMDRITALDKEKGFDLNEVPFRVILMKFEENRFRMLISNHHILYDGWSTVVILEEFFHLYKHFQGSIAPPTIPAKTRFREFIRWLGRQDKQEQKHFWTEYLHGYEGESDLSFKKHFSPDPASHASYILPLTPDFKEITESAAAALKVTPAALFYCCWGLLLQIYNNNKDIVFGTTTAGRPAEIKGIRKVVGLFINTIPLRLPVTVDPNTTLNALLTTLNRELQQRSAFEHTSLVDIKKWCPTVTRQTIFDSIMVVENYPLGKNLLPRQSSLEIDSYAADHQTEFHLTVEIGLLDQMNIQFTYNELAFDPMTIQALGMHYYRLLESFIANPGQKRSRIDILSHEEKIALVDKMNREYSYNPDFPAKTLHFLFAEQAERTPHRVALVNAGGPQSTPELEHITYYRLNQKADSFARSLIEKGAGPETIAAVRLNKGINMITAILGIIKTGAAYMPIDPGYPQERIDFMMKDSNAALLLSSDDISAALPTTRDPQLVTDKIGSAHLAYIIYTSGTTGKPKGVMVEHQNVTRLAETGHRYFQYGIHDTWTMFHSFCFDFSVWEMYGALLSGGKLVIIPGWMSRDPVTYLNTVKRQCVTIMNQTPPVFYLLVEEENKCASPELAVRSVIFGGDTLKPAKLAPFRKKYPQTRLVNMYGITETTVHVTFKEIGDKEISANISNIGRPLATYRAVILDPYIRLVPAGVPGELYVGGSGVARGYLNRPELTAEKFVHITINAQHFTLYRSGDLARMLPDGELEYLGRSDHQVKIRGNRVELGEIESRLMQSGTVKEAVLLAQENEVHQTALCAYVVMTPGTQFQVPVLREQLSLTLPQYMMPSHFIQLESIPLTASGKVDRKKLPEPGEEGERTGQGYAEPPNVTARKITAIWQDLLKSGQVGIHDNFFDLGGDSLLMVRLHSRLQKAFRLHIPMVDLYRYPTIHEFMTNVIKEPESTTDPPVLPGQSPAHSLNRTQEHREQDIAVIGIAGRFPGAGSVDRFWENLKNGVESVRFFSQEELAAVGIPVQLRENKNYVNAKAPLEDVDCFDSSFFNYTLREAEIMDPQLRILHECAWTALEDAAYNPFDYGGKIGIYAGATTHLFWISRVLEQLHDPSQKFAAASLNDAFSVTTQIAYRLNLNGPAVTIQTACSTSLTAIHHACEALVRNQCDMALAGGVSVQLPVKSGYLYQEGMVFSPDGHCRPFDNDANGTVEGHGVGIVVLKSLKNARADNDHIYAVVKATAINNDGNRKPGYTAPSVQGQAEVIEMALENAGLEISDVTYVETHGTGTPMGDLIELQALKLTYGKERNQPCRIGSVKSNIGHLDSAAGAAGFIKTVLALRHRMIPPTLHVKTPNKELNIELTPFIINRELIPWQHHSVPLRAGVSSFGIGGTNAHIILEEAPARTLLSTSSRRHHILTWSAQTPGALEQMTHNLRLYFKEITGHAAAPLPADIEYTLQIGRKAMPYRRSIVCTDLSETIPLLTTGSSPKLHTHHIESEYPTPVFLYPGLGAQYTGMGRDLYKNEPLFREAVDKCIEIVNRLTGQDFMRIMFPDPSPDSQFPASFEVSQFTVFIYEYALTQLLLDWGIVPAAVLGYSFGEYSAACTAGVFTPGDALALIHYRGRAIAGTAPGAMLSVPVSRKELEPFLSGRDKLALAIDNGTSCIVAGTKKAIAAFEQDMKKQRFLCMRLNASHALHSPLMTPILPEFKKQVTGITLKTPQLPMISNVTGTWLRAAEAVDPEYWGKHLCTTVRFGEGIQELAKEPNRLFIEIGPGRDLSALTQRYLDKTQAALHLDAPQQQDKPGSQTAYLLECIGKLWTRGITIDWLHFHNNAKRNRVSMPTYPFAKQRFSVDGTPPLKSVPIATIQVQSQEGPGFPQPCNSREAAIAAAFKTVFGLQEVGIEDDFFELGGDSLKAISMAADIHRRMGVEIPLDKILKYPTVKSLAEYINSETLTVGLSSIQAVEQREYYPLSPAQARIFILHNMEGAGIAYNMPSAMWLEGSLDIRRIQEACRRLIQHHESLRTRFLMVADEPVQQVCTGAVIDVETITASSDGHYEETIRQFIRPFDLSCAPLWRVGLIHVSPRKFLLVDDLHHIIADDISIALLITQLSELYSGSSLQPLSLQYKEFALWEHHAGDSRRSLTKEESFWLERFRGELPVLQMPTDFPRPPVQTFKGADIHFKIEDQLSDKLSALAKQNKTTLFVSMFTVFTTLLYRYSGQEDIIAGTPVTGRSHSDMMNVVGMFVNTLAIRVFPSTVKTFSTFLNDVKKETLNAFANSSYPFEELVDQLNLRRDLSRNPLFDTMFVLHTVDLERIDIEGLKVTPYRFENPIAHFDITVNVSEGRSGLNMGIEYNTGLYKKETILRFKRHFLNLCREVVNNPRQELSDFEILSPEEREELLQDFNHSRVAVSYPRDKTIHSLFEEQVRKHPHRIALVAGEHVTYQHLNLQAEAMARHLIEKGVRQNNIVAIMLPRGIEIVIAILGTLKAGAAYLPIDPTYPRERINYILKDSNAALLVTIKNFPVPQSATGDSQPVTRKIGSATLAYIIYTSGTTGKPKGTLIEHCNVVRLMINDKFQFDFSLDDTWTLFHSYSFDFSVWEMYGALLYGGRLVSVSSFVTRDTSAFNDLLIRESVTVLNQTPSAFYALSEEEFNRSERQLKLRYVILGGEALNPIRLKRWKTHYPNTRLINMYGITETTVHVTFKELFEEDVQSPSSNIGQSIPTLNVYVVDSYFNLQPIGVPGELIVGGTGVARGYLNRPELSAEKFIVPSATRTLFEKRVLDSQKLFPKQLFSACFSRRRPGGCTRRLVPSAARETYSAYYRSGDLAKRLPNGDLEFLGRIDQQVKIRGHRIELGEIESVVQNHKIVEEAAVIAHSRKDDKDDLYLCAYIVPTPGGEAEVKTSLPQYVQQHVPGYMVPSFFEILEEIPLTHSGKLDRASLPEPGETKDLRRAQYTPAVNKLQRHLVHIWSEVLGIAGKDIGIDHNFFEMGGHSLRATKLVSKIHRELKVKLPLDHVFKYPTIREMSACLDVKSHLPGNYAAIQRIEKREYYVMSPAQKRLYLLQQLDPQSIAYNMPAFLPLSVAAKEEQVEKVFKQLIQRHESLRTSFHMMGDQPVQVVQDIVFFQLQQIPSNIFRQGLYKGFSRPFDLSCAPLLRAGLTESSMDRETGKRTRYLVLDLHHIITDGTSLNMLTEEFLHLYGSTTTSLPPLQIQYKDYAQWQHNKAQQEALAHQESYWLNLYAGEIPVLNLPLDYPRPAIQSFEGAIAPFTLEENDALQLKELVRTNNATLYMALLSVFSIFLSKLSAQEDIIIGTPVAGRRHADLEPVMGMFVNTLAMRVTPNPGKVIVAYLEEVKEHTLKAYENQEYPFEELVEKTRVVRDTGRNPIFDVLFNLLNMEDFKGDLSLLTGQSPGTQGNNIAYQPGHRVSTSKFDLNLMAVETEQGLLLELEYATQLFKPITIDRFNRYFKQLLGQFIRNPEQRISHLELLSDEEKKHILSISCGVHEPSLHHKTIHDWFHHQAQKTPHRVAFTDADGSSFSYEVLDDKSTHIAGALRERGAGSGEKYVIAILMERTSALIFSILGILKAGCAYLPIDPGYPDERIGRILRDSNAILFVESFSRRVSELAISMKTEVIQFRELVEGNSPILPLTLSPTQLCYIIYTSGSTGNPKGVMLRHNSLVNLLGFHFKHTGIDCRRVLQFTSIGFDVSFQEIFSALLSGGSLFLIHNEMKTDLPGLFNTIERSDIKTLFLSMSFLRVMFAAQEDINRVPDCLTHIVTAGEQLIVSDALRRYLKKESVYLHNHYGPSETHVVTTHTLPPTGAIPEYPSIGRPVQDTTILILDKSNHLCPMGVPGELFISGIRLGGGYLNRPELTAEKFIYLTVNTRQFSLYRSGDLAKWLPDGYIQFLGRNDHQVKIRGIRVELEEIEARLNSHENIRSTVVTAREISGGDRYLCAYIVPEKQNNKIKGGLTDERLKDWLSDSLPEYMVPSYFITLESIPLTPNGKTDRKNLPEPQPVIKPHSSPRDRLEKTLSETWASALNLQYQDIGINDNFFTLGGHSLTAMVLVSRIHKKLGVNIRLKHIFQHPTIHDQAVFIRRQSCLDASYTGIQPVEIREYYPLSPAQKRLYILQQMDPLSTVYNLPSPLILTGNAEYGNINRILDKLVQRHESLRTSFHLVNNTPVQRINDRLIVSLDYTDPIKRVLESEEQDIIQNSKFEIQHYIKPFDLSQAPLVRTGLFRLDTERWLLFIDMHHIVSDGVSIDILIREFIDFYHDTGEAVGPLYIQYKDYTQWLLSDVQQMALGKQKQYWLNIFSGDIPVLSLPYDFSRPDTQRFEGETLTFALPMVTANQLRQLAKAHDVTMFMLFLAIFNTLLSKLSCQEDIIVGSPVAGRRHSDLLNIAGMFVNTLTLRNRPLSSKTFGQFLDDIKQSSIEAFENQDYPLEDLVEQVAVTRDAGRNPLFDVVLVLQNQEVTKLELPDVTFKPFPFKNTTSKFDMTWTIYEQNETMTFNIEFCTAIFQPDTISRYWYYFCRIIPQIFRIPTTQLANIEIISPGEKEELLFGFNRDNEAVIYPFEKTIHSIFEEQAEKNPQRIALIGDGHISYRQLDIEANHIAGLLMEKGVRQNSIVAIILPRGLEMITAVLGILKAGAAYMPIDPNYPRERIDFMLKDSSAALSLTTGNISAVQPETHNWQPAAGKINSASLAYIIYTSGTTGKPKGTLIEHRNVVRLMTNEQFQFEFSANDTWTLFHSVCFDFSVWEMYGALLYGGKLVMVPLSITRDSAAFNDLLIRQSVTVLNQTPSAFYALTAEEFSRSSRQLVLRYIIFGGEALNPSKLKKWPEHYPDTRLINMYGITETTVHVTFKELTYRDTSSPSSNIGMPIPTLSAYVVDKQFNLLPIGVPGELLVGGAGVVRGYLNRPELTAEKFIMPSATREAFLKNSPPGSLKKRLSNPFYYRSGDLVKRLPNGDLEYLGRIDQQVKVRGHRIELGEIEGHLTDHPDIHEAVVISRRNKNEDIYLCAYIVYQADKGDIDLRRYLSLKLPGYMVPSFFVPLSLIPLTANGKLDKKALPPPQLTVKRENGTHSAPTDTVEAQLVKIWRDVLGLEEHGQYTSNIGIDDDFFLIGGQSLNAIQVINGIHKSFHVKVPIQHIFQTPTIRELAVFIRQQEPTAFGNITALPSQPYYDLSYAQKRLWVLYKRSPDSPAFNMPVKVTLNEHVSQKIIQEVLLLLAQRHENLRTYFLEVDGEPKQAIQRQLTIPIQFTDLTQLPIEESASRREQIMAREREIPFDIEQAPLLRINLVKCGSEEFDLIFNVHHLVFDGWSLEVMQIEFFRFYREVKNGKVNHPEPLPVQYKEYAHWHNLLLADERRKQMVLESWRARLREPLPVLSLPYDFPPEGENSNRCSAAYQVLIDKKTTAQLEALARDHGASLFMVLLSGFYVLLNQVSGQDDILLGMPGAARQHRDIENVLGLFVNTLILRNRIDHSHTFSRFLKQVRSDTLEILEYQDYPMELICDELGIQYPKINLFFNMVNIGSGSRETASHLEVGHIASAQEAKFEIALYLTPTKEGIKLSCSYYNRLFLPQTIEKTIQKYIRLLKDIAREPGKKLREIQSTKKKRLLKRNI